MTRFRVLRTAVPVALLVGIALGLLTGCASPDRLDTYQIASAAELDSGGIHDFNEGAEYNPGALSIYGTSENSASTQPGVNLWLTVASVIGLIASVGIICFLLYLDRMLRKLNVPSTDRVIPTDSSTPVLELYLE